ncbi:M28 family peptidase [Streptomyces sp. NBC_00237]|uniref:M28 family peptidase n=1 Tax=Streptomyces sp. NBC_00237 TaxID=2975687 RepID=UPI00224E88DA|nr:M28 family peptidase [Streptomyces sp. NBC_00237]MCX5204437.1 M28 family peptidase [Streptomyces sp. NBC_00237]
MRAVTMGKAGIVGAALLACLSVQTVGAAESKNTGTEKAKPQSYPLADRLAAGVEKRGTFRHLREFQRIADSSGGNRGYNRIGFDRSVSYVKGELEKAGYRAFEQKVPYTDFDIDTETLSVKGAGEGLHDVPVFMTRFTPSTGPDGTRARLVTPNGDGCKAADYAGVDVAGAVVVLARSTCKYALQQQVAAEAGARAVLLYERSPKPDNISRLYGFTPPAYTISHAVVSQRVGERIERAARKGGVEVDLTLRGREIRRTTVNLVAETRGGDPDNVVLMGAHLDSVPESAGINDNASSASAVLETAISLAPHQRAVKNKVRFVWWGAEELINVGSQYYVDSLSEAERGRVKAVLNGELLGSSNYARFVWDPETGGSHVIADVFGGYFDSRGLPYERVNPNTIGSDHLAFQAIGIPVGGVDGGNLDIKTPEQQARYGGQAGEMFDSCYHQTCDVLTSINRPVQEANSTALAWVLGRLATYDGDVTAAKSTS